MAVQNDTNIEAANEDEEDLSMDTADQVQDNAKVDDDSGDGDFVATTGVSDIQRRSPQAGDNENIPVVIEDDDHVDEATAMEKEVTPAEVAKAANAILEGWLHRDRRG